MDWGKQKDILVFIEQKDGHPINAGLECLTPACTLAKASGGKVLALLIGTDNAESEKRVSGFGADVLLSVEGEQYADGGSDAFSYALEQVAEKYKPAAVLAAVTPLGRELTARLSAKKGMGSVQDAVNLHLQEDGTPVWTIPLYSGTILNDIVLDTVPFAATTRSGAFSKPEESETKTSVTKECISVPDEAIRKKVLESVKEITEAVNLEDAKVIVAGGRGMGKKENFALLDQLAKILGGVVGATRPAVESEWISRAHQVGQSGKNVAPALYIGCGISGATQHVSGIMNSGYIVAINKDEDAPIFDIADLGIVGDAMQVLPVMIEEIQKRKA